MPGYKKPQGKEYERFKHHLNEVWVQSTQRAGGGDHSDHVFKRFDKNGEETPFENAGSKGEYVKGNMQPSLRSRKAVETYLERVAKAAGRKGAKEGEKAKARLERDAGAGEKDKKDAAEKSVSPDAPAKSSRDDRAAGKAEREIAAGARDAKGEPGRAREMRDRGGREAAEKAATKTSAEKPAAPPGKRDGKRGRRSGDGVIVALPPTSLPSAETLLRADADAIETGGLSKDKEARFVRGAQTREQKTTASEETKAASKAYDAYDAEACRAFASAPAETLERRAAYVLAQVSGHVASIRAQIAAERAAPGPVTDGAAGAAASRRKGFFSPQMLPGGTYRLVCDRCSGSIADGHRNCAECGSDYCVECCAEMRVPPRRRHPKGRASAPRELAAAKDGPDPAQVRCPNCLANATGARADAGRATSAALAFKVRCVSVTTQRSLAVAKAMPDPLADVDGLADRYGERAFERRRAEARELAEWVAEADRARAPGSSARFSTSPPPGTPRRTRRCAARRTPRRGATRWTPGTRGRTPPRSSGGVRRRRLRVCARDATFAQTVETRASRRRKRRARRTLRSPSGRRPRRTWTPVA